MFVLELTYLVDLAEVDRHLEDHRAFLRRGYRAGVLLASGPKEPRTGGVMLARGDRATIDALIADDPFTGHGVARYDVTEFHPSMTAEGLDVLR